MTSRLHTPQHAPDGRADLKSMSRPAFVAWCGARGVEAPRAARLFQAIWQQGLRDVSRVPGVAAAAGAAVMRDGYVPMLEPELVLRSVDGTVKVLFKLEDGRAIESVLIPDGDKRTLCISTQVGCAMACTFCLTGDLGLVRHLKPSEIAGQVLQVGALLPEGERITNVVVMGEGEPLHNLEHLCTALEILLDDHALRLSHRRITVSTVGLVEALQELARRLPVNLAISLHATTDAQRRALMPVARKHDLAELMAACRALVLPSGKRLQFEYLLLAGVNDSDEDAERLAVLLADLPSKVNLIPYNDNPDRALRRPEPARVAAFKALLHARGVSTTVRVTRGLDVSAACGQLGKAWQQAEDGGWLAAARAQAGFASASTAGTA